MKTSKFLILKWGAFLIALVFTMFFVACEKDKCSYTVEKDLSGTTWLTCQKEIDNFSKNYPGVTVIPGSLRIDIGWDKIDNLDGLSHITAIQGNLGIGGTNITNVKGLSNLTEIGGWFSLYQNGELRSLSDLKNLHTIGGDFVINLNDQLTSFEGLENLTRIGGTFRVLLSSFTSFKGLENLTSIGGAFTVHNNYALISFEGLENLDSIVFQLGLVVNPQLITLDHLKNLASVGSVDIRGNTSLSNCSITAICDLLQINGNAMIEGNATGCDTVDEILAGCQ